MKNDWKVYRIGERKIYEFHNIDGEEHIYDYDENRMLTETEKRLFSIQMRIKMKDIQAPWLDEVRTSLMDEQGINST